MPEKIVVRQGQYHDSAFLMRIARELTQLPRVSEAVVLMGTPMNRDLLAQVGFASAALDGATPLDLVLALRAEDADALATAEQTLARLLEARPAAGGKDASAAPGDASLAEALTEHPAAQLVSVSVPGAYAAYVARRALEAGRHVFLFSNNVALEDEITLKQRGVDLGLLVMGPDCGTAIIAGVGLGFANRVPRGPVGIVGASGTGIQEVSCQLAHLGLGVSQAIGTGSRDLSAEVGGVMTEMGLRLLAADPATRVLVLVCKHPAEAVAARLHRLLLSLGKPAVVRYLGRPPRPSEGSVCYAPDLDDTAARAAALAGVTPAAIPLTTTGGATAPAAGRLVGLFGGGSLAAEAQLILEEHGLATTTPDHPLRVNGRVEGSGHLIVDVGEDFYTVGKPHPMVDQAVRCSLLTRVAADPGVGTILFDLVLGDGAHLDPAPELAAALAAGRRARGSAPLRVVASVCGTDADPQNAARQASVLAAAEVAVVRSAAHAAHLAAQGVAR